MPAGPWAIDHFNMSGLCSAFRFIWARCFYPKSWCHIYSMDSWATWYKWTHHMANTQDPDSASAQLTDLAVSNTEIINNVRCGILKLWTHLCVTKRVFSFKGGVFSWPILLCPTKTPSMEDVGYCKLLNLSKDNSVQNTRYEICSMTVMMFSVPVWIQIVMDILGSLRTSAAAP